MIQTIRHPARPAGPATPADEETLRILEGTRRALPIQRLVGNGMDYADAAALHALAEAGMPWTDAATWAGEANLARAAAAQSHHHTISATSHLFHAAACFRFAQSALMQDTPQKIALYRRALDAFTQAAALAAPAYEKIKIPWPRGPMHAWLVRPESETPPPCVVIFGGADGWREEYHPAALALRDRGLATLLLDGPGQGETRLLGGLHLHATDVADAYATAIRAMIAHPSVGTRVGIWGNSLGGTFAALTASACPEIAACCVNGGSATPVRAIDRTPRLADRLRALTGDPDTATLRRSFEALALPPDRNRIACPLLVLHGHADALFPPAEGLAIAEAAPSTDRTVMLWEDGDHCIYNHTHEKHCAVGDWFIERLK